MVKVLITGGTGLIGQKLTQLLEAKGYEVAILSRNPSEKNQYKWDIKEGYIDEKALKNTDYIIHLAGAGIADKRWTDKRKKVLMNSRVQSANLLFSKVKELNIPLNKFISASAIGYYGAVTTDIVFTEKDPPGNDFVSTICVSWENAAFQFNKLDIPVTVLRTGVVLAKDDGALDRMNTPLFLAPIGSGKQYMPWIHVDDLCSLYVEAIEKDNFIGVFNAVAPNPETNKTFTKILGKVLHKPVLPIHVPSFILQLVFGKMANIILEGSRISTEKTSTFYNFKYHSLNKALTNLYDN
ncbi:TIGR01777 family oxidoreductase [Tenacibaculum sp. IB213877]|uniref:TIGR01777 family oxidoreductase n=1 Tax=Tenacibaculum sp. IB213877 TaxID=3097351 RepID=UPI002A5A66E2|nr:TIGR01777 family oxidoreductase [Tenacibaculum sp. IB213877]MDY0779777.1 TIGR01777 family oxidoreductase [Tenacibaculum sp. IB213877]